MFNVVREFRLGRPVHYMECWHCWRFQRFKECKYRIWVGNKLYCFEKAKDIDDRLFEKVKMQLHNDDNRVDVV